MISEVINRKFDGKFVVWTHLPCNRLGIEPYCEDHVANFWTQTGVFDTKEEALRFAKVFHTKEN